MDAQLGNQANINLGGYIPAAARQPKLWQQVLASFLGNVASHAGSNLVDAATSPDPTLAPGQQPWYRREMTPNEMVATKGQAVQEQVAQHGMKLGDKEFDLKTQLGEHGMSAEDTRLALEGTRTAAGVAQGDRQTAVAERGAAVGEQNANTAQANMMAGVANDKERSQFLKEQLGLEKEKFHQAQTVDDRSYALARINAINQMLQGDRKNFIETEQLKMEKELNPAKIEAYKASASSKNAYGDYTTQKSNMQAEARRIIQNAEVNRITNDTKLTPQQKEQQIQAILSRQ